MYLTGVILQCRGGRGCYTGAGLKRPGGAGGVRRWPGMRSCLMCGRVRKSTAGPGCAGKLPSALGHSDKSSSANSQVRLHSRWTLAVQRGHRKNRAWPINTALRATPSQKNGLACQPGHAGCFPLFVNSRTLTSIAFSSNDYSTLVCMEILITPLQSTGAPVNCQAARFNEQSCENNAAWRLSSPGFGFNLCAACIKRVHRELEAGALLADMIAAAPAIRGGAGGRDPLRAAAAEQRRAAPKAKARRKAPSRKRR